MYDRHPIPTANPLNNQALEGSSKSNDSLQAASRGILCGVSFASDVSGSIWHVAMPDACLPKPHSSLFGAITIQLVKYFYKFPGDTRSTKVLVCILDVLATMRSYIVDDDRF